MNVPPPSPEEREALLSEARAKLAWGSDPLPIRQWLVVQGLPAQEVDGLIHESLGERARELQRQGLRSVLKGVVLCGIGGTGIAAWPTEASWWGNVIFLFPLALGLLSLVRGASQWLSSRSP